MRTGKPINANHLKIKRQFRVLEIGSGHNPTYRADVLVEKFLYDNTHRCGNVKVYAHQTIIEADGDSLPFKDKEFDYVICKQCLEHVEDPVAFVNEIVRVGKQGYLETPSIIGEFLFPKKSHKWVVLDIDDKLVLYEKTKLPGNYGTDYGELFLNYLPYNSLSYKILTYTNGDIMINRYEWSCNVDILVNPEEEPYHSFFFDAWKRENAVKLFPKKSVLHEVGSIFKAICYILYDKIHSKIPRKNKLLSLDEYRKLKESR